MMTDWHSKREVCSVLRGNRGELMCARPELSETTFVRCRKSFCSEKYSVGQGHDHLMSLRLLVWGFTGRCALI